MTEVITIGFTFDEAFFYDEFQSKVESALNDDLAPFDFVEITNVPLSVHGLELLSKEWFKTKICSHPNLFGIKFKLDQVVNENFSDKPQFFEFEFKSAFIIGFQSSFGGHESKSYWKISGCDQFYSIYIDNDESENITELCHEFLVEEIKQGRNGILNPFINKISIRLQEIGDQEGKNLLIISADKNYPKTLKSLLEHEFDADDEDNVGSVAIDYAWLNYEILQDPESKQKSNNIILSLLNANSRFPSVVYEYEYIKASKEVHKFVELCESLHRDVTNDDFEALKIKLDGHLHLVHFYDRYNRSLLSHALIQKNLKIINFLNRISTGIHEDLEQSFENIPMKDRAIFRNQNQVIAKELEESHLLVLRAKTKIGNNAKLSESYWKCIEDAYKTLNQNQLCSKILKIVAQMKKIRIYFDFKHNTVYYLDPMRQTSTQGTAYSDGTIYIGAKFLTDDKKKSEVCGVLAHELCHLAILVSFMNSNFDPFQMGPSEEKKRFKNVVMIACNKNKEVEEIVENAFLYPEDVQESELIVTVPQMLMHYHGNQEKIQGLRENFPQLFDYCKDVVESELDKALPVLQKIENLDNFVSYKDLTNPMKAKILYSPIIFQTVKTTFMQLIGDDLEILKFLMADDIRTMLMKNKPITISGICELNLKHSITERDFIKKRHLDDVKSKNYEKYKRGIEKFKKNFDSIKKEVESSRFFILSDHAGTGKTTIFKNYAIRLKNGNSNHWVSYIDLKRYEDILISIKLQFDPLTLLNLDKILLKFVESKTKLDAEIFKKLFFEGRVIFFFDGVDEVCPRHSQVLMRIFELLRESSAKNQVWVSTRPHYASRLELIFEVQATSFVLYTQDQKIAFIEEILSLNHVEDDAEKSKISGRINAFIWSISYNSGFFDETEYPLIIEIITELHIQNSIKLTLTSHYELYHAMIYKQREKVGSKIPNADRDIFSKLSVWDVHKVLALIVIIGDDYAHDLGFGISELSIVKKWKVERRKGIWTADMIQRYGLVLIDLNDPEDNRSSIIFTHKTYAEFFIAQYFIDFLFEDSQSKSEIDKKFKMLRTGHYTLEVMRKFIYSYLRHEARDDGLNFHEDIQECFIKIITEIRRYLRESDELSTLDDFEMYAKLISSDKVLTSMLWGFDEDEGIIRDLLLKYDDKCYTKIREIAEYTFGEDWHQVLDRSGSKLQSDSEIEKLRNEGDEDDENWIGIKNSLKLCQLVDKNFSVDDKRTFFEQLNLKSVENGKVLIEIVKIMKNSLHQDAFTKKCLIEVDLRETTSDELKAVLSEVEIPLSIQTVKDYADEHLIDALTSRNPDIFQTVVDFYKQNIEQKENIQDIVIKMMNHLLFLSTMKSPMYEIFKSFVLDIFEENFGKFGENFESYIQREVEIQEEDYANLKDFIKTIFTSDKKHEELIKFVKILEVAEENENDRFYTVDGIEYDCHDAEDFDKIWENVIFDLGDEDYYSELEW